MHWGKVTIAGRTLGSRTVDANNGCTVPLSWLNELTPFVGRGDELAAIASGFKQGRPVTITGLAGLGKSRLAAQFVAGMAGGLALDLNRLRTGEDLDLALMGSLPAGDAAGAWIIDRAPLSAADALAAP